MNLPLDAALGPAHLDVLGQARFFSGLDRKRLARVAALARAEQYPADTRICSLGDPAADFYVLADGMVPTLTQRRGDSSSYDLLASEARLCIFVAIAQGQLPQESWFALGCLPTTAGGQPVLLSWSGSMFEYLMPLLVMPTYENTLLDRTSQAAVRRQVEYGKERCVPWGMSESGYNMVDVRLNYQYRAFGLPGLGLKRGLASDLVVAPYASALALMVVPRGCVPKSAAARGRGVPREIRFLRGHRLHPFTTATRAIEGGPPVLYVAAQQVHLDRIASSASPGKCLIHFGAAAPFRRSPRYPLHHEWTFPFLTKARALLSW